jgi:hypothetical protein
MTARIAWSLLGWVSLALGVVGAALPVMPTTVFVLLAAFAFGKGSPGMRRRLVESPRFGPAIRDWEERGAIRRRHKALACAVMAGSFGSAALLGAGPWVLLIQGSAMGAAAAFVLSRPSANP